MTQATLEAVVFLAANEPEFSEYPTDPGRSIRGNPLQRTWHHFTGADGRFLVGYWEAEPGCWRISYTENEFCRIQSGRSILRDGDGNERELTPGDEFVIPSGFEGEWEVLETTRKLYVICEP